MNLKMLRMFIHFSMVIVITVGNCVTAWSNDNNISQTRGFYASPGGGNWGSVQLDADFKDIQRFSSLPPGKYIANASAALASSAPEFLLAECVFMLDGTIQGELSKGIIGGSINNFLTLPLTLGFTLKKTKDLSVACRGDTGVSSQPSPITIISVDRLKIQRGFEQ